MINLQINNDSVNKESDYNAYYQFRDNMTILCRTEIIHNSNSNSNSNSKTLDNNNDNSRPNKIKKSVRIIKQKIHKKLTNHSPDIS